MKTKRDPLDKLFSDLVRERASFRCENCFGDFRENPGSLHCSHFFSRRKRSTRFCPQNACAHCFSCHQKLGENPIQFTEFIKQYLEKHYGPKAYPDLLGRQAQIVKIRPKDKLLLRGRLKESWAWMEQQRREGVDGRIEFDSPYDALDLAA